MIPGAILSSWPAAICPSLCLGGQTALADAIASDSFLELIGQLLQLAPVEDRESETDSLTSAPVSEDSAPPKEESEEQRSGVSDDASAVPVWSTIPAERTVLPWTLNVQSFEPESPVRVTAENKQNPTPAEAATPVAKQTIAKVSPPPIAFVAEIESAPPVQDIAVIGPAKPTSPSEVKTQAVAETEVRIQDPLGPEPKEHNYAPPAAVESVEAAPEFPGKARPKQPAKSETLSAAKPAPTEQDAPAVQAVRKESPPADHDNPEPARPFTPAPAKKVEKGSAEPRLQPQATAIVTGAPQRESSGPAPEKAPESPEPQPVARTQVSEKPSASPRPPVVRDVAMRVSAEAAKPVDIRLSERGGKVEVTVRTPDPELRTALQKEVGHLVERLETDGFHTNIWTPGSAASVARMAEPANLSNDASQEHPQHRGSQEQPGGQRRHHHGEPELDWMEEFESNRKGGKNR